MACPIIAKDSIYSKDRNLWHIRHEGDILEDPANEPKDMFVMSVEPEDAPNTPAYLEIGIEPGYPLSLNGNNSRHLVHSCSIAVWSKGTSGCSLESMIWIFCHSSICKLPRQESRSGFQKSSMAPTMKTLFRPLFGRRYSGWDISPPRNSFSSRA